MRVLPTRSGFTFVELMIVVALIGVLAALGVSNWYEMQLKARRTEPMVCLQGIADAEVAYEAVTSEYAQGANNPGPPIGKQPKAWDREADGWKDLGWEPDGLVRCSYISTAHGGGSWFRVDAYCDIDGDDDSAIIRYYSAHGGSTAWFSDLYPNRY